MANIFAFTYNIGGYYGKILDEINSKFNEKVDKINSKFNKRNGLMLNEINNIRDQPKNFLNVRN
jgi:hypothetical protein